MGFLAFRRGSGMAAHSRKDKGFCLPVLELIAENLHELFIMGQASAAGSDADAFSFQGFKGCLIERPELLL